MFTTSSKTAASKIAAKAAALKMAKPTKKNAAPVKAAPVKAKATKAPPMKATKAVAKPTPKMTRNVKDSAVKKNAIPMVVKSNKSKNGAPKASARIAVKATAKTGKRGQVDETEAKREVAKSRVAMWREAQADAVKAAIKVLKKNHKAPIDFPFTAPEALARLARALRAEGFDGQKRFAPAMEALGVVADRVAASNAKRMEAEAPAPTRKNGGKAPKAAPVKAPTSKSNKGKTGKAAPAPEKAPKKNAAPAPKGKAPKVPMMASRKRA